MACNPSCCVHVEETRIFDGRDEPQRKYSMRGRFALVWKCDKSGRGEPLTFVCKGALHEALPQGLIGRVDLATVLH